MTRPNHLLHHHLMLFSIRPQSIVDQEVLLAVYLTGDMCIWCHIKIVVITDKLLVMIRRVILPPHHPMPFLMFRRLMPKQLGLLVEFLTGDIFILYQNIMVLHLMAMWPDMTQLNYLLLHHLILFLTLHRLIANPKDLMARFLTDDMYILCQIIIIIQIIPVR